MRWGVMLGAVLVVACGGSVEPATGTPDAAPDVRQDAFPVDVSTVDASQDADASTGLPDAAPDTGSDADAGACTPNPTPCAGIAACGTVDDGCGTPVLCGTCEAPKTCGGGGVFGQCG